MKVSVKLKNPLHSVSEEPGVTIYTLPDVGTSASISLHHEHDRLVRVEARRGITSNNEVYWTRRYDGSITISDSFKEVTVALEHNPGVAHDALIDLLLFRTVPGTSTLAEGVSRLGHGETVLFEAPTWTERRFQSERLQFPSPTSFHDAVDRTESALQTAMDNAPTGTAQSLNLFSGGVDSTLVQVFLGQNVKAVSGSTDQAEYRTEREYACQAAELLEVEHERVMVRERDYIEGLADCVKTSGIPPHHMQTILLDAVFASTAGSRIFWCGEFADSIYGTNVSQRAMQIRKAERLLANMRIVANAFPKQLRRLKTASTLSASLLQEPFGTSSLGAGASLLGDHDWCVRQFGLEAVSERIAARLHYVRERLSLGDHSLSRPDANLVIAHMVSFLTEGTLSVWREVAHSRGHALLSPFPHPLVVHASMLAPVGERFSRSGQTKPILKAILGRRLHGYDVAKPKGSSGLPMRRMLDGGVLEQATQDVSLPFLRHFGLSAPKPPSEAAPAWWSILNAAVWWSCARST